MESNPDTPNLPKIDMVVSPDQTKVIVTIPSDPPVRLELDADHVDSFIAALANARGQMLPAHAPDLVAGKDVIAAMDPRWVTATGDDGTVLLHLRDPRVGWMHYVFPRHEAGHLGAHMVNQSNMPSATEADGSVKH